MAYKPVMSPTSEWSDEEIQEAICDYYYRMFITGQKPKYPDLQAAPQQPLATGLPKYPMLPPDNFVEKKVHWRDAVYSPTGRLSA